MDMEIITALTVICFGVAGVVLVCAWIVKSWRDELARNRERTKEKPPRVGTTNVRGASERAGTQQGGHGDYGR